MSGGAEFLATRYLDLLRERDQLRAAIERTEAVLAHARLVSPSPSMTVYVADVAAALAPQRQCRDRDDHPPHHHADQTRGAVWSCQGRGPASRGARPTETT